MSGAGARRYGNVFHAARLVLRTEGVASLYRGITPVGASAACRRVLSAPSQRNVWLALTAAGAIPSHAVYFATYEVGCGRHRLLRPHSQSD